jgi:hypothetical protein
MVTLRDGLPDRLDGHRLPGRDREFRSDIQDPGWLVQVLSGSRTGMKG